MGTLDNGSPARTVEGEAQRIAGRQMLSRMLDPALPATGPLQTLAQLLAAEERLDELEALGHVDDAYEGLRQRVLAFVVSHPELTQAPWLRCGGAVYDMLEQLNDPPDH